VTDPIAAARETLHEQCLLALLRIVRDNNWRIQLGYYGTNQAITVTNQYGEHIAGFNAGWGSTFYDAAEHVLAKAAAKVPPKETA
jgi:hypothetical protein